MSVTNQTEEPVQETDANGASSKVGLWSTLGEVFASINPFANSEVKVDKSSLRERDRYYVIKQIEKTLTEVNEEQAFHVKRTCKWISVTITGLMGIFLVIWGLALTPLFGSNQRNYVLIAIGFALLLPSLLILYYLIFPTPETLAIMKQIELNRIQRASTSAVSDALRRAHLAADAERVKLDIIAQVNRHSYPIQASSMGEFIDIVTRLTGLPKEQMLLVFDGEIIKISIDKTLVAGYGFLSGDVIHVFNKGGYELHLQKKLPTAYKSVAGSRLNVGTYNVNWKAQAQHQRSKNVNAGHSNQSVSSKGTSKVHPMNASDTITNAQRRSSGYNIYNTHDYVIDRRYSDPTGNANTFGSSRESNDVGVWNKRSNLYDQSLGGSMDGWDTGTVSVITEPSLFSNQV